MERRFKLIFNQERSTSTSVFPVVVFGAVMLFPIFVLKSFETVVSSILFESRLSMSIPIVDVVRAEALIVWETVVFTVDENGRENHATACEDAQYSYDVQSLVAIKLSKNIDTLLSAGKCWCKPHQTESSLAQIDFWPPYDVFDHYIWVKVLWARLPTGDGRIQPVRT